ncbi:MAG: ATP-dependent sacrificial sulfur transferase LarE, partial [Oscillospiraceae bacterium]|nr:ATP-dependent sacrificial sulfur transferase LarE [Oscillospiraceae bacterium]
MNDKYEKLKEYLKSFGSVAVAFSGGADSAFLLKAAHDALSDKVVAVTANSHMFPRNELNESIEFCRKNNIRHIVCDINELEIDGFSENPPNRCYICKKKLLTEIKRIAAESGIAEVAEGSNLDDNGDYRPGLAAVAEMGIKSTLREVGFTKNETREISRQHGLHTWDKPAFACLSSRFAYGEKITPEKLDSVDKAESLLKSLGLRQMRVRIHGDIARIEVMPEDFEMIIKNREMITCKFKEYGFSYAAMDLVGYRMGSMN